MLHTLNNNYEPIQELRERGYGAADFDVKKATVEFRPQSWGDREWDEGGDVGTTSQATLSFPSKEVYYRTDTLEPIAIHGLRYKPIQYPTMIDKTRDMLERCNLDATGIQETISVSSNGGMCAAKYILPAKKYTTPDGDTGCLTVLVLSSFNSVWGYLASLGFKQDACLNSQIFIKNPASIYKARHTNKLDIDLGVSVLGKAANIIEDEIELWHDLYCTPTNPIAAFKVFAEVADYKDDIAEISWNSYKDDINNKSMLYLVNRYHTHYAPLMGRNLWAVYNTVTDWSTHAPSSAKNKIALMQRRTDKASEVMTKHLLAA